MPRSKTVASVTAIPPDGNFPVARNVRAASPDRLALRCRANARVRAGSSNPNLVTRRYLAEHVKVWP